MILFEIALRHLLGTSPGRFVRTRLPRFLTQALLLALAAFIALRTALAGHPVYGLLGALAAFVLGSLLLRVFFGAPPPEVRGAYASAVTYVAVLGIAIASASVLVVVSVMEGLQADIRHALLRTTPAIEGIVMGEYLDDPSRLIETARRTPGVAGAWGRVDGMFLLTLGPGSVPVPVEIRGVPEEALRPMPGREVPEILWDLSSALAEEEGAVFGLELARRLGLKAGDEVDIISPAGVVSPFGVLPSRHRIRALAAFKSGFYEIDADRIYVSLPTARALLSLPDSAVTAIEVVTADASPDAVTILAEELNGSSIEAVRFLPWMESRRNLYIAMETEKKAMFLVESLLILVASFNITATLFMVVSRKTAEIAILRVLGLAPSRILALFSFEGALLGGLGGFLGIALGYATCLYIRAFPLEIPGGGEVYYIKNLPVNPSWEIFAATAALVFVMTLVAALLPARTASRLQPAEVLRHG